MGRPKGGIIHHDPERPAHEHVFAIANNVGIHRNELGVTLGYTMEVRAHCDECGVIFEWMADNCAVGAWGTEVTVDIDRTVLRAPLRPRGSAPFGEDVTGFKFELDQLETPSKPGEIIVPKPHMPGVN